MKRWKKGALIITGILLFLAGLIGFVLPGMVRSNAVQRVEASTARKLVIKEISINPFTWAFEIHDLRLSEPKRGDTFAAFSSARVVVSPLSLFRMAPIIASARINTPYLNIVRTGANTYNFNDLLKLLPRHPRLSLNNLTITNGSIDFIDHVQPGGKRHELRRIELAVPFVTNIPYLADRYITPSFSAVVNGSPLHLEGKLRPFPRAAEVSATIVCTDVSLPDYLAYLPGTLPVRVGSGILSAKLSVSYRTAKEEQPELGLNGSLTLTNMKAADLTGAPFLALARLDARIARARLLAGEVDLSSISADGLEVFLSRDRQGVWSHSRLASGTTSGSAPARKALVSVAKTRLSNGRFHFVDRLPRGGFAADLENITLDMQGYSTSPGKRAGYALSFTTTRGEKGNLKGEFSPLPLATSSSIELSGLSLDAYHPYLPSVLPPRLKGKVAVAARLEFGGPEGLRLEDVAIQARQLSAPFGKGEGITLASLSLDKGRFSQKENLLEVAEITLRDGELRFSRNRRGALLPLTLLYEGGKVTGHGRKPATAPLQYRIGRISGSGMSAVFTDEMLAKRPGFTLEKILFSLEKLDGPPFGPVPFRVAGRYGKAGSLKASGSISPAPWRLKGIFAVDGIPLADFNPYLPENLSLVVAGGKLDARLAVSLAARGDHLTGRFDGSAGIRSLYCLDSMGKDLLKWESLRMDRLKGSLDPFVIDIGDLALARFHSRIIAEKDGSLNILQLYTRGPEIEKENTAAGDKVRVVRLGTVTMQAGTIVFTDHHVAGGYTTTLYNLGGRISGLSSGEDRLADLDLRGNLENRSPLRITGRINPFAKELYADIRVSFTDIGLAPMTPYSGTYLGYAVDRGQLFLESRYRIGNRRLESENRVVIDQLDFGRRIESDKATSLPVLLAVALLKDRKGEIHIDLPVTGRTDDPQFSAWRVAREILKNLLVTADKSPFALLQSMFGTKDDLSSVVFDHGSTGLSPVERDKLLKLATAMDDRPGLKIDVTGFVDREHENLAGEQQLRSLAEARTAVVRRFLVEQGKIDSRRIFQKSGDMYRAPAKAGEHGSRVEFGVVVE